MSNDASMRLALRSLRFNIPTPSTPRPNWDDCIALDEDAAGDDAPIEAFYRRRDELLTLSRSISGNVDLMPVYRLLLLGLVGATETFFRDLHLATLRLCPFTAARAAALQMSYGAVQYYGPTQWERAALDRASFTSIDGIREHLKKQHGVVMASEPGLGELVVRFVHVAHLRHAIVHNSGFLGENNARTLDLVSDSSGARHTVNIDASHFDRAVGVCVDLVRLVNSSVAKSLVSEWLQREEITGSWSGDRSKYAGIVRTFVSCTDSPGQHRNKQAAELHRTCKDALGIP